MDDLLGQDWSAPASSASQSKSYNPISNYPGLRPSPAPSIGSGASSQPLSRPSSTVNNQPGAKPGTPANDSFASLLGKGTSKAPGNLSIQERQRQLLEEKRKQEAEQRQRYANQFGAGDVWDQLGSRKATPEPARGSSATGYSNGSLGGHVAKGKAPVEETEDDILAAFNRDVPVDKSSHFPPPASDPASGRATPAQAGIGNTQSIRGPASNTLLADEDDDPFGLGSLPQKNTTSSQPSRTLNDDDDDILGDLAKPIFAKPPQRSTVDDAFELPEEERAPTTTMAANPHDRAVAELVDMGFPADTSRVALQETDGNLQAAVSFLLTQAHEEAKQKSQGGQSSRRGTPAQNDHSEARASSQRRGRENPDDAVPAWMRADSPPSSGQRKADNKSPGADKDVAQFASEFGTSLFKSANSLWKQGRKQVQKAVSDLQAEHDAAQPKWMRDASVDPERSSSRARQQATDPRIPTSQSPDLTNEAALLESGGRPQKPRPSRPAAQSGLVEEVRRPSPAQDLPIRSSTAQDVPHRPQTQPQARFQQASPMDRRPATKLSRLEVEAQSEQAYISPARRKRPTKPEPQPEPEVDLFSPAPAPASRPPQQQSATSQSARAQPAPKSSTPSQPIRPRPAVPPRSIPPISTSVLSTSSTHRRAGTEAFKRGDYDTAHNSYTAALAPLPPTHPIVIIILSNRALTAIKTGDPKTAISDADRALTIIGVSKGENEKIDLGSGEGEKDMREFYGKALMRKAEALEHMEKWTAAADVWKLAVEAGVGGAVSIRGRDRCEKAANPASSKSAAASSAPKSIAAKPAVKPAGRSMAPSRPAITQAQSAEAVKKLREANAAAEKADDEKFALTDHVDAKLVAWKGTKADNLRALLGSLDTVLWPEAGWKKVGMSDLVIPGKVKIIYMKAIAKVHPDKVSHKC